MRDDLLSKSQVAAAIGASEQSVLNYTRAGLLPEPVRYGGRVYWNRDAINEKVRTGFGGSRDKSRSK